MRYRDKSNASRKGLGLNEIKYVVRYITNLITSDAELKDKLASSSYAVEKNGGGVYSKLVSTFSYFWTFKAIL